MEHENILQTILFSGFNNFYQLISTTEITSLDSPNIAIFARIVHPTSIIFRKNVR